MLAVPTDQNTPDLYSLENDLQGGIWLRGLTAAGEQKTHLKLGSSNPSPDHVVGSIPDNAGGVLAVLENQAAFSLQSSVVHIDGVTGSQTWRYDSPGSFTYVNYINSVPEDQTHRWAVDPDGNFWTVETVWSDMFTSATRVIRISPSGMRNGSWNLPSYTGFFSSCGSAGSGVGGADAGPISIAPDGSAYLEVLNGSSVTILPWDCSERAGSSSIQRQLQLLRISPGGAPSWSSLSSCTSSSGAACLGLIPQQVIPDGNGSVLAAWISPTGDAKVTHVGAGELAMQNPDPTNHRDMVLGDQGRYFTSDGTKVVAVDEASDNPVWTWQPSQGTVEIIAATAGGGLTVRHTIFDGQKIGGVENVVRLDASGNATYDSWGTADGSTAYGVLGNANYYANGLWIGQIGDPVLAAVYGDGLDIVTGIFASPQGNVQHSGGSQIYPIYHFVPFDPAFPDLTTGNYVAKTKEWIPENLLGHLQVRHFFRLGQNATISEFLDVLRKPSIAIGLITHGAGFPRGGVQGAPIESYGFVLANGRLLTDQTPANASLSPGDVKVSKDEMRTQAKIIFIGACWFSAALEQWLGITPDTAGRTLIAPTAPDDEHVGLGYAADAWWNILQKLTEGKTTGDAVNAGNAYVANHPDPLVQPVPTWSVVGDRNVTLK